MNIENLKEQLLDKRSQLIERIKAIGNDFKKGRPQDFAEHTTECENDEVLGEIQHEAELELKLVNEALVKINNDQYGVCSTCDDSIALERLAALPYVTTCIRCAQ